MKYTSIVFLFIIMAFPANHLVANKKEVTNGIRLEKRMDAPQVDSTKNKKEIFGFYPNWLADLPTTYDGTLCTSMAYLGYELEGKTGNFSTAMNWNPTKLMALAKAKKSKQYLTLLSQSEQNNRAFLATTNEAKAAQKLSITKLLTLVHTINASGVVLYFNDVPCDLKENYASYINTLSKVFTQYHKKVVVVLPGVDSNDCYDVAAMEPSVGYFIVLADNYYDSASDIAGPVAPLHGGDIWTQGNLEYTLANYLAKGIPKKKLLLSLRFYGTKWETIDDKVPSYSKFFIGQLPLSSIQKEYAQRVYFDAESQTNYMNFKEGDKNIQIWFDDAKSLAKKYDFINENQLGGIGVWIGNKNEKELWNVVASKFIEPEAITPKLSKKAKPEVSFFKKKEVLLGVIVFILGLIFVLVKYRIKKP